MTYEVRITISSTAAVEEVRRGGFPDAPEGAAWVVDVFKWYMRNWGDIDENGLTVTAEITYEGWEGFSDMYELRCGC